MRKYNFYIISVLVVAGLLGSAMAGKTTSAVTYQSTVTPEFTINESLSVTVSSEDIAISGLTFGQSKASDAVNVTVVTNNYSGYTLTSTAGDGNAYTDTNLINSTDSSSNFTSLDTSASIADPTNFGDGEWGYSFSTDSQATWSNYSGLPYYDNTGATLVDKNTQSAVDGDVVNFRIAAKASETQPAGTYNNVINFAVVGK